MMLVVSLQGQQCAYVSKLLLTYLRVDVPDRESVEYNNEHLWMQTATLLQQQSQHLAA